MPPHCALAGTEYVLMGAIHLSARGAAEEGESGGGGAEPEWMVHVAALPILITPRRIHFLLKL